MQKKSNPKIDKVLEPAFNGYSNPLSIIESIKNGITYLQFESLLNKMSFSLPEWSNIMHVSIRTLQRYKKESLSLDPLQSEKVFQVALLYRKGIEIFGSKEKFDLWLSLDNLVLGGVTPKSLLDTAFGIELLSDELTRIEHGILS